ncbi:MAG TPA: hypothetical protein VHR64_02725 [Thermomicrobiales bacterium]|jgi:hypothetical protein|nr:hypothetical protein [Thermomicrobiales bacterium]
MDEDPLKVEEDPQPVDMLESGPRETARIPSETVGTGSYVALSCTVMTILATLLLIAGLLIYRWLS